MFSLLGCPIDVAPQHMSAIVRTESSANQYAIGVVGHRLSRQPHNLSEALQTVKRLDEGGYNYSVGLAQVNKVNFGHYLDSKNLFSTCANLLAGSRILNDCYKRVGSWKKAYSCYYSGNPVTGFTHGYVQKVVANRKKQIVVALNTQPISHSAIEIVPRRANRSVSTQPPSLIERRLSAPLSLTLTLK